MRSGLLYLPSTATRAHSGCIGVRLLFCCQCLIAAECWSWSCQDAKADFREVLLFAAARTDLTGRCESDPNGLRDWHSIALCGSLINSLQSAVFKYNIPFQPRNANLRVIGCSTIFRQTSCKFVRVLSFLHFLFLSLLQRFYIFLTGIPVAVFLTYINVFIGECSVRAKQKSY